MSTWASFEIAFVTGPTSPSFGSARRCARRVVSQPRVTTVSLLSVTRKTASGAVVPAAPKPWFTAAANPRFSAFSITESCGQLRATSRRSSVVPSVEPLSTTRTSKLGHSVRARRLSRHSRFKSRLSRVTTTIETFGKKPGIAWRTSSGEAAGSRTTSGGSAEWSASPVASTRSHPRDWRSRFACGSPDGSSTKTAVAASASVRRSASRPPAFSGAIGKTRWPAFR